MRTTSRRYQKAHQDIMRAFDDQINTPWTASQIAGHTGGSERRIRIVLADLSANDAYLFRHRCGANASYVATERLRDLLSPSSINIT